MKKLTLTVVCALAVAGGAFAQGTVNWSSASSISHSANELNGIFTAVWWWRNGQRRRRPHGHRSERWRGRVLFHAVGSDLYRQSGSGPYELGRAYVLVTGVGSGTAYATNGTVAGRPIQAPANDNGQSVLWANGTTQSVVLVGWSANLGTSWYAVSNELETGSYLSILQ